MLNKSVSKKSNGQIILFLGRDKCDYSLKGLSLLNDLGFETYYILSKGRGEKLPSDLYDIKFNYIFCFRSFFILPEKLLRSVKKYSINFHPGPPNYPGSGCINFSFYNDEKEFGVTCHLMNKSIDSGEIIDFEVFPFSKEQNILDVLEITHLKLYNLFISIILNIKQNGSSFIREKIKQNENIKWSGVKRKIKDIDDLSLIDLGIEKNELERRIRSFHTPSHPLSVLFHGKKFIYSPDN